jgi:cysteinyl-tRNA synthetase
MVELIGVLLASGAAYEAGDGVYFAAEQVADYGLLTRQSLDSLRAGARVEANDAKRAPVDFALWKKAKPGEPSWQSPWGAGRPGWHTECVVMSLDLLGDGFDVHGGALDLVFPHHENERAQAVAAGHGFARHWVHNGLVEVEGTKMSKSLGNFTTLAELIETVDPRAYRLLVLRSHYRSPIEVNAASTADAAAALERLDAFARRTVSLGAPGDEAGSDGSADPGVLGQFVEAMDDDLDTPAATALIFDTVKRANTLLDAADEAAAAPLAAAVAEMCEAVGLQLHTSADVPAEVLARAVERDAARASRDYAAADAIRAELQADGWTVEDTPGGTVVRR